MLDHYFKELAAQAQNRPLEDMSARDLAKLAGVKLAADQCPECGGRLSKSGSIVKCSCGFSKSAALPPALQTNVKIVKAVQDPKKRGAESAPRLMKKGAAMPHFTEQDRPQKVKEIYRALKRDNPDMPADMKARIAIQKGGQHKKAAKQDSPDWRAVLALPPALAAGGAGIGSMAGAASAMRSGGSVLRGLGHGAGYGALIGGGAGLAASALIGVGELLRKADPSGKTFETAIKMAPAAVALGGAMADIGSHRRMQEEDEQDEEKTSSWNRVIQKVAQDISPEEMQGQLMEGDPETMRRQYGMAGAVGGSMLGGLASLPLMSRFRGAGKLLGLAAPAVGGLAGGLLGARAGEAEAGRESAMQQGLYQTGLQEGAMMGAQSVMNQLYGQGGQEYGEQDYGQDYGDDGMGVYASAQPSDLKKGTVPDSQFDPEELARGIEIEKEHSDDPAVAKAITKAHLSEIRDYNTRLDDMEEAAKREGAGVKEGGARPFDKSAAFSDVLEYVKRNPGLLGGLVGGAGGAGIGAATADEGHRGRGALVGGLTGLTLGGLGGAFAHELGFGSDAARAAGFEMGLQEGARQGKLEILEKTIPAVKEMTERLQQQEILLAERQAAQAAQETGGSFTSRIMSKLKGMMGGGEAAAPAAAAPAPVAQAVPAAPIPGAPA